MSAAPHPSCPFCDVIHGAGEVSMCYEDTDVVAFMDIQHYESLEDIPREMATHVFDVAMMLAPIVKQVGGADGMNIVVNSGAAAGQDVFHYHVHVIPRCPDDGFDVPLPFAGSQMPDRTVLDANAARIIAALRDPVAMRRDRRGAREDRRATSR